MANEAVVFITTQGEYSDYRVYATRELAETDALADEILELPIRTTPP